MKSYSIERARHLVLRAGEGDVLPDDVARVLTDQGVTCGWIRASGVLGEVELRVFDAAIGGLAEARRIAGPVQALSIEGSVGLDRGEASMGLHAVLARETDRGMAVLAGEIVSARVVALEAFVTAFEDLSIGRALDARANVVLFGDAADARYRPEGDEERPTAGSSTPRAAPAPVAAPSAWSDAIAASAEKEPLRQAASRGAVGGAIPPRPVRPARVQDESQMPEAGDIVEHFAFGRSEVLKSDGDRLHLKVGKDGRIREIALEMLKVSPLESNGPYRRFKLDRKM
ncbi:MAG: PPC domain-containing DNA-binding protein [Polyangiaceae bacterium]